MSVVGLITEYNPFHNGHLYHIQEAKRITNADTVVVVMSGNFVQRGTAAMVDKYTRTRIALKAGADLVIELPVCYSTSSAEYFSLGAVSILDQLGFVDYLVFGSECGDVTILKQIADLYSNEPIEITMGIQSRIKNGITYPAARAAATIDYLQNGHTNSFSKTTDYKAILNSPNNILGIEYIKALNRLHSSIIPQTIQRIQADFHNEELSGSISSATAIRKAILMNDSPSLDGIKESIPDFAFNVLSKYQNKTFPIVSEDLDLLLNYRLLQETSTSLTEYQDINEDLANRIKKQTKEFLTFEDLVDSVKSKQYTQTRIQRALLHVLLNITKDSMELFLNNGITPYARILGFKPTIHPYLKKAKELDDFTIISKLTNANLSTIGNKMLQLDLDATHLYHLLIANKFGNQMKDEYKQGIIVIK